MLGRDEQFGSLAIGRPADIIAVNLNQPHVVPALVWPVPRQSPDTGRGHDCVPAPIVGHIVATPAEEGEHG